jgi:hypothetical protein
VCSNHTGVERSILLLFGLTASIADQQIDVVFAE